MAAPLEFMRPLFIAAGLFGLTLSVPGQTGQQYAKQLPPPGILIAETDRVELLRETEVFQKEIESVKPRLTAAMAENLPDVRIYQKAVFYAANYHEIYRSNEVAVARNLLKQGRERLAQLRNGTTPWTAATGLVVRAYVSKIDGSIQPYGLVVPASFAQKPKEKIRLDCWFHGRDETLTELKFVDERQKRMGEFAPGRTVVLHLYGRYCNASKFAGETDLFEAMNAVRAHYPIDENRISVRGFSMGGASVWHLATHHAGLWVAASPGAGFAETPEYMKIFPGKNPPPPWYEQALWHLYNATDYAENLFNCPLIAYSGEVDPQRESADIMERVMAREGLALQRIIGPKTGHKYEPEAKQELARRFDSLVETGAALVPNEVRFSTWTLRYNRMKWVVVDALEKHWAHARVHARIRSPEKIEMTTTNVAALTLSFPDGFSPFGGKRGTVFIDGQALAQSSDSFHFQKAGGRWQSINGIEGKPRDNELSKRHGLQGPIDDAFMDSFIFVRPTGKSANEKVGRWAEAELERAIVQWRGQFRGDARVKNDTDISESDMAGSHLVLWGDPESNRMLGKLAGKLPLQWGGKEIRFADRTYPAANHAAVLIFPNPLNPKRYIVLNSGFTFRGFGSNAGQTPKLPDYAIINLDMPASEKGPGEVVAAGFFDEKWGLPVK